MILLAVAPRHPLFAGPVVISTAASSRVLTISNTRYSFSARGWRDKIIIITTVVFFIYFTTKCNPKYLKTNYSPLSVTNK